MSPLKPFRKKLLCIISICSIGFSLIVAELSLRLLGFEVARPSVNNFHLKNSRKGFFAADELLGFTTKKNFEDSVILSPNLSFWTEHDSNGFRKEKAVVENSVFRKSIWILGCSFTYGWGVENKHSFPFLLSEKLQDWEVKNWGIPAYSTLQSKILLENLFSKTDSFPEWVVLAYASFHDQRNTGSPFWLQAIQSQEMLEQFQIPVIRRPGSGIQKVALEQNNSWGTEVSALANLWNQSRMKRRDESYSKEQIRNEILLEMAKKCEQNQVRFAVAILDSNSTSVSVKKYLSSNGIPAEFISVNLNEPGMSLMPADPHPSIEAHQIFAKKLFNFLEREKIGGP